MPDNINYTKIEWKNGKDGGTPLNATNLDNMDSAIASLESELLEIQDGIDELADKSIKKHTYEGEIKFDQNTKNNLGFTSIDEIKNTDIIVWKNPYTVELEDSYFIIGKEEIIFRKQCQTNGDAHIIFTAFITGFYTHGPGIKKPFMLHLTFGTGGYNTNCVAQYLKMDKGTASDTYYDRSKSKLKSTNVQNAIDELASTSASKEYVDDITTNILEVAEGKSDAYILSCFDGLSTCKGSLGAFYVYNYETKEWENKKDLLTEGYFDSYTIINDKFFSQEDYIAEAGDNYLILRSIGNHIVPIDGGYSGTRDHFLLSLSWKDNSQTLPKVGDIFLITEMGVPDRWYGGGLTPAIFYTLDSTVDLTNFVEKTAEVNKVYGTSSAGTPQNYTVTDSAVANTIARRDTTGSIKFKDLNLTGKLLQKDKTTFVFENPNSGRNGETVTVDAAGEYSVSLGGSARAEGKRSVAEGTSTIAQGGYSHAEGNKTITTASNAHAEGLQTVASGVAAHSEGELTVSSGQASHAEGRGTKATALGAHAEGVDTTAYGSYSHTGGYLSEASGAGSFAHGRSVTASHDYQIALGQRNEDKENTVLEVGWSETDSVKRNVFEVYKDGHAEVAAAGTTDNSVITKGYVDSKLSNLGGGTQLYKHNLKVEFDSNGEIIEYFVFTTRDTQYEVGGYSSFVNDVENIIACYLKGPNPSGRAFYTVNLETDGTGVTGYYIKDGTITETKLPSPITYIVSDTVSKI